MNVMKLLEYLSDIIETSTKLPMTGKSVVNKKEVCEVINDIISALPDELKKAQWILSEKDRIINDALKEAEIIRQKNSQNMLREIENHNITKEAKIKADEIIASAQKTAKEIRLGSKEYAENILNNLDREIKQYNGEMLTNIKAEMEQFLKNYQSTINSTSNNVRDNLKEIKKIQ